MKYILSLVASIFLGTVGVSSYNFHTGFDQIRAATWQLTGEQGTCSAVAIKPDVLLTAAHCDQKDMLINGKTAIKVKKDESTDLMLLYVPTLNSPVVSVADESPEQDTPVVASGYPLGQGPHLTEGRMQYKEEGGYMRTTTPIVFGNSGGGMFAFDGFSYKLVGINSAIAVAPIGFFPIPVFHMSRVSSTEAIQEFLK